MVSFSTFAHCTNRYIPCTLIYDGDTYLSPGAPCWNTVLLLTDIFRLFCGGVGEGGGGGGNDDGAVGGGGRGWRENVVFLGKSLNLWYVSMIDDSLCHLDVNAVCAQAA